MKASELRRIVEEKKGVNNERSTSSISNLDDDYGSYHETILNNYLEDVGAISKYINDGLKEVEKNKNLPNV